eukprot:14565424-Alexandrium_andersonii.AAC.1
MSASLVGSEMCIRDSAFPAPEQARPPQGKRAGHAALPRERHPPPWRSSGCLLYTSDAADDM